MDMRRGNDTARDGHGDFCIGNRALSVTQKICPKRHLAFWDSLTADGVSIGGLFFTICPSWRQGLCHLSRQGLPLYLQ